MILVFMWHNCISRSVQRSSTLHEILPYHCFGSLRALFEEYQQDTVSYRKGKTQTASTETKELPKQCYGRQGYGKRQLFAFEMLTNRPAARTGVLFLRGASYSRGFRGPC